MPHQLSSRATRHLRATPSWQPRRAQVRFHTSQTLIHYHQDGACLSVAIDDLRCGIISGAETLMPQPAQFP
jgi:hypothetical protein